MTTVLQTIGLLISTLFAGVERIRLMATPLAQEFLEVMVHLAFRGILIPVGIGIIGLLGGATSWTPGLWSNIIALAGLVSFAYLGLMLLLATPIGAVVLAALPDEGGPPTHSSPEAEVTWQSLFSPNWIVEGLRSTRRGIAGQLREGVKRYFHIVRVVLAWEGFTFFFLAAVPSIRSMALVLILGALAIGVSQRLQSVWTRVIQVATLLFMAWYVLGSLLPKVNLFTYIFKTIPKEFTLDSAEPRVATWWSWINTHWSQPAFILVALVLGFVVYKLLRGQGAQTNLSGGTEHGHANAHGSKKKSETSVMGIVATVFVCAMGFILLAGCGGWAYQILSVNSMMASWKDGLNGGGMIRTPVSDIRVVAEKAIDLAPGQPSEITFVSGDWRMGPDTVKNEQVLVEHLLVRRNGTVSFYATNTVAFWSTNNYSAGTEVALRFTNRMTNAPLRVVVRSNKSVGP